MEPALPHMPVYSVDDRHVGEVACVNECCLGLETSHGKQYVAREGVFNVAEQRVTLICMAERMSVYRCKQHSHCLN